MNSAIEQMLKNYQVENIYDKENAMKEIIQEIVLCGLSRAGFFDEAAFYGGTALRIFYGLTGFRKIWIFRLKLRTRPLTSVHTFQRWKKRFGLLGLMLP